MPYKFELDYLPGGFTLESGTAGSSINVCTLEFLTFDDGALFIERLEKTWSIFAGKIKTKSRIDVSKIGNFLAIINPNKRGIIYINELQMYYKARVKGKAKKGIEVFEDDLADILRLDVKYKTDTIVFPENSAVVFLFSLGWRKALFYDYTPLIKRDNKMQKRDIDLNLLWGQYLAYIMKHQIFNLSESEWSEMFEQGWFPFTSLKTKTIGAMISLLRENKPIDMMLKDIAKEVTDNLDSMLDRWKSNKVLDNQLKFIERARERFENDDYLSAGSIIYPRIEGIIRMTDSNIKTDRKKTKKQKVLARLVKERAVYKNEYSMLLPNKYYEYISQYYFKTFKSLPSSDSDLLNRNLLAHGIAGFNQFNLKACILAFLIIDQLSYILYSTGESNING